MSVLKVSKEACSEDISILLNFMLECSSLVSKTYVKSIALLCIFIYIRW